MDTQSSMGTFKRKKKRVSSYQRAVKYSKRGKFGHGFQIQDDDFQYFLNILKVSKETFDCDEDKRNSLVLKINIRYVTLNEPKFVYRQFCR